jgi:hypothetical protein
MAKNVVVNGATIKCTGSPQSSFLRAPPNLQVKVDGANAANIHHHKPVVNVLPFGPCKLQPGHPPCMPVTPSPWSEGEGSVPIGCQPVLDIKSHLKCTHGGKITFLSSGQSLPFFSVDCHGSRAAMAFARWREAQLRYVEALKAQFAAEDEADHLSTWDMVRNTALETAKEASGFNDAVKSFAAFKRGDIRGGLIHGALAVPNPFGKAAKGIKAVRGASKAAKAFRAGRSARRAIKPIAHEEIRGATRAAHRAAANRDFAHKLGHDPDFRHRMNQHFGQDVLAHMKSGKRALKNPPGAEWHHPIHDPHSLHLLHRHVHRDPNLQHILHPGPHRSGGMKAHHSK